MQQWCPTSKFPVPTVVSQNISNKTCLVCVKSKKFVFLITLRTFGSMRQDKAELCKLQYQARRSQGKYTKTQGSVSFPPKYCLSNGVH